MCHETIGSSRTDIRLRLMYFRKAWFFTMRRIVDLKKDSNFHKNASKIYLVYFCFFLCSGPLQSLLSYYYFQYYSAASWGFFSSVINLVSILLPTTVTWFYLRHSVYRIAEVGILLAALAGILIGYFGQINLIFLIFLSVVLFSGRIIFNNSYGNFINYKIESKQLTKFLSVRDIFLYAGISLGSIISGLLVAKFGYRTAFSFFSILFLLAIIALRAERGIKSVAVNKKSRKEAPPRFLDSIKALLHNKSVLVISLVYLSGAIYGSAYDFSGKIGLSIGLDASTLLSFSGIIVFVNAIIALIISSVFVIKNRKWLFVFDITFDAIPALIFAFSNNQTIFLIGLFLSMIKDIFSPMTFGYIISRFSDEEGVIALGFLGSVSSLMNVAFPSIFGLLWNSYSRTIFIIAAVCCVLAGIVSAVVLDSETPEDDSVIEVE